MGAFMPKRTMACRTCGGDCVVRDAWASWSYERQEWELGDMFDYAFCIACETECAIQDTAAEMTQPDPSARKSRRLPTHD